MFLMLCNKCSHEWEQIEAKRTKCMWCEDGVGRPVSNLDSWEDFLKSIYGKYGDLKPK